MITKVVFLVFGMSPRIDRRIKEFVKNGYDVDVYGGRSESTKKYEGGDVYTFNAVYESGETYSYKERLHDLPKLRRIIKKYDKSTTLFYCFSLNTAVLTLSLPGLKYIYEESDMLFDRFKKSFLRNLVIKTNKRIIKKSVLTVFTSEGFADYYFGNNWPSNLCIVPNRVSPDILQFPYKSKELADCNHLRFGNAGNVRYKEVVDFSKVVVEKFPNHEFHFFGDMTALGQETIENLKAQPRVFVHGSYQYPSGLSEVYDSLDFIVCTYNANGINPQYAEPNKLYEAIYYETPIIVSSNTFLAKKVERLGIGFSVNADNLEEVFVKVKGITPELYKSYVDAIKSIPKEEALNINTEFFDRLKEVVNNI